MLFPRPLHLVRQIEDPISRKTSTIHEYCAGNQIITVSGSRVVIADYDRQQLTEIDRQANTYSVTRFEEIAKATPKQATASAKSADGTANGNANGAPEWKSTSLGMKSSTANRSVAAYELTRESAGEKQKLNVGLDPKVMLSRDAIEVLIGAAWPNPRGVHHDAVLNAAGGARDGRAPRVRTEGDTAGGATYALPVEQSLTIDVAGESLTMRSSIISVTSELPSPDVTAIPPGLELVESRLTRAARELRELDQLPPRQ
ncbi:MAG TPA: hypothetical protein VGF69_05180 [Thermoanaerobaculia bacterium]